MPRYNSSPRITITLHPAIVHMHKVISQCEPRSVTLLATACLTNVALLLSVYPNITEKLEQIVVLGTTRMWVAVLRDIPFTVQLSVNLNT